jgi:hypothetical protein
MMLRPSMRQTTAQPERDGRFPKKKPGLLLVPNIPGGERQRAGQRPSNG